MLICRVCDKEFPKPATRGRPPVKCEDCRNSKTAKAIKKAVTVPSSTPEPTIALPVDDSPNIRRRRATYRTGFCGVTVIDNKKVLNSAELHRLCRGKESMGCNCKCHDGVDIWKVA